MKIVKINSYKKRFDIDGKQLEPKLILSMDVDIEITDIEESRKELAKQLNCDFVEVGVIEINKPINN